MRLARVYPARMKKTFGLLAAVAMAALIPSTASASGPFLDTAEEIISYTTNLSTTRMNTASDGSAYYHCSGGSPSGTRFEKRALDGTLIRSAPGQIDCRSILFDTNTNRLLATSYNPNNNSPDYGIFTVDRDTLVKTKLYNAPLAGAQSMPSLDPTGEFFYVLVPSGRGLIRSYRVADGSLVGDVVTLQLRNNIEAGGIARSDFVGGMFVTWDRAQKMFRAYDAESGVFLGQSSAAVVGNSREWFSYADGKAWVYDTGQSRWRGFQVLAGPAPEVSIEGGDAFEFEEGGSLTLEATGTEGVTYSWDLDGDEEFGDAEGPTATIEVLDGPATFTATVQVRTEFGRTATDSVEIVVHNLDPVVEAVTADPLEVEQFEQVSFSVTASDPAAELDFLTYRWSLGDGNSATGAEPTHVYADVGEYSVTVSAFDGDGGSDSGSVRVEVVPFTDGDEDGAPDGCERQYGLNPEDPNDGEADNDMDGISNRDECLAGTDPTRFNGPSAPAIHRPSVGSTVDVRRVPLVVSNASDPDGDDLVYEFELYTDEELSVLVASVQDMPEGFRLTTWEREEALVENGTYWWRARAHDPHVAGAWTQVGSFFVDTVNEAPEAPEPISPMGTIAELRPTLEVRPAVDPEGDRVTYSWEIIADTQNPTVVEEGVSNGPTWRPRGELEEDHQYYWRCAAVDSGGERSPRSVPAYFVVNQENQAPPAPTWVAPADGAVLSNLPVILRWAGAEDPDHDVLTYELEVATSQDFAAPLWTMEGIEGEEEFEVEFSDAEEDATHWARVRAWDGEGAGPWATVSFTVDAENSPPTAPVLIAPQDDARVAPGTVTLRWQAATDPEGGELRHVVRVFSADDLSSEIWSSSDATGTAELTVDWDAPDEAATYAWSVTASDDERGETTSTVWEFSVVLAANEPPTAPTPVSPVSDIIIDPAAAVLAASPATDPEGDLLTYEFEIFADEGLSERVFTMSGISEDGGVVSAAVSGLPAAPARYWWRVRASDAEAMGPWSNTAHFRTGELDVDEPDEEPDEEPADASGGGSDGCATAPGANGSGWALVALLGLLVARRRS